MVPDNPRAAVAGLLLLIAALIAYGRAMGVLHGTVSLEQAFTPGWVDFAIAHPLFFALIAVGGTYLLGRAFVTFLENV